MKEQIIEQLKEYGWNYVVDRFTEQGRHHFQKYSEVVEAEIAELEYVLIFDYGYEFGPHLQTCRKCGRVSQIKPFVGKVLWGCDETIDGTALYIEELELFTAYMKELQKER